MCVIFYKVFLFRYSYEFWPVKINDSTHTHAEQYCYCICAKNLDFFDKEYNTHIENVIDRFNISFSVSKFLKTKRYVVYGKYVRYLKKKQKEMHSTVRVKY